MRPHQHLCRHGLAVVFASLLTILLPSGRAAVAGEANLVANGDFATVSRGRPDLWNAQGDSAVVTQSLEAAKDSEGKAIARLVCTRCERQTASGHAMLAQVGVVGLTRGRMYEFSCRMREENLAGRSVSIAISDTKVWENCGLSMQAAVSPNWKSFRRVFRATRDVSQSSRLQFWFNETGTLEVADVKIVEVRAESVEFTNLIEPVGGKNLLPNGSFEIGASGWSSMGQGVGWGDLTGLHGRIETGDAAQGRSFLRIPLGGTETPLLYFDYYELAFRREIRPLAASKGWIRVEPGAAYTLSCSMRASIDGTPAMIGVRAKDPSGTQRDLSTNLELSKSWKRYAFTFRPQQRYVFVFAGPNLKQEQRVDVDIDAVQLEKGEAATDFSPRSAVEWAIEPARRAGIFTEGQAAAMVLSAANFGDGVATLDVRLEASDYEDKTIELQRQELSIPPKSTVRREIRLPADWRGYYLVGARQASRSADQAGRGMPRPYIHATRIAIVPERADRDSVLGINHAFPSAGLIGLAKQAGVAWYRDWSIKWQHIEPKQGEFHWELADAQIDRVLKEDASVLPLLPPFPSADWCSEAPAGLPMSGYPGSRLRSAWGPKDPKLLAEFIGRAVTRYSDRIHIWEFLNEPIYTDYALPADSTRRYKGKQYSPADYVRLPATASAAMRQADPSCKVIGGIGSGPRHLTKDVIDAGILKHIDIFNLHMYPGNRSPESFVADMDYLLGLMDAAGGRKPIWITEFSYYGADDLPRKPFIPSANSWAEERLLDSERQRADYTVRYMLIMLSRGVQKVFIHSGASGKVNEPNYECAVFADDGTPRKAFATLAVMTNLLGPAPKPAGVKRIGAGGHAVAFETARNCVVAVWQTEDADAIAVSLPSGDGLKWCDAVGRALAAPPKAFSPSPVYLTGPKGKAAELLQAVK